MLDVREEVITLSYNVNVESPHLGFKINEHMIRQKM